jgi:signal transduction histidine kinase
MERDLGPHEIPRIAAPRGFVERRHALRRDEDRTVHEERALLARAVDVLAGPGDAASQLGDLLALVARAVGARRAALLVRAPSRRVLVAAAPGESSVDARGLAAWLDARAPDPPAVRAARAPAQVVVVRSRRAPSGDPTATARAASVTAAPGAGAVAAPASDDRFLRLECGAANAELGLELRRPADAAAVAGRLPETTLRHLVAALAAASARVAGEAELADLRARERERERFVAVVAHELRTPLAGLGGYLDLLAAGAVDDPEVGHEFIQRSRGIVERMTGLVGDLLEMSRLEAGSLRLEIEAVSLAEACERAIAPLEPLVADRAIRLSLDLPPRLRTARADRRRLEQVVANLAANASKFTPEGGLVEVVARFADRVALVIVRDDGPGISRTDLERIFQPFARLAGHERIPGTGLGLPISRDLARAMGGDLAVAAVPGCGSAFILGLPTSVDVARAAVGAALAAATEAEEVGLEERAVLRALRAGTAGAAGPGGRARAAPERSERRSAASREAGADAAIDAA